MNTLISINNVNVSFEVVGNEIFANSLQIAEVFGKDHANVLKAIKNLPKDNFNHHNFKAVEYKDAKGELRPCYNLTRDGFSLLVMGFTGERAYKFKIEFIKAFNEMEKRLKILEQENIKKLALHQSLGYKSQLAQQKEKYQNKIKALQYDLDRVKNNKKLLGNLGINHTKSLEIFKVQGEMLMPYIKNGEFAIIEKTKDFKNGDVVIFELGNDTYINQAFTTLTDKIHLVNKEFNQGFVLKRKQMKLKGVLKAKIKIF